jgi:hypothetical protein
MLPFPPPVSVTDSVWLGGGGPSVPVPESATVSGLLGALLVTMSVALATAAALGAKVTVIEQLAPTASVGGQEFCWPNSAASAPPIAMPLIASSAPPVLETVSVLLALLPASWSPKESGTGPNEACGIA